MSVRSVIVVVWFVMLAAVPDVVSARPVGRIPGLPGHDVLAEEVLMYTSSFEDGARDYRKDFGRFPKGGNREVCRQLFGLNPKGKRYVPIYSLSVFDDRGNLFDPWLEPYQFTVRDGNMRLSSHNAEHKADRRDHLIVYPATPHINKARYTRSNCYKIALATRLLVQRTRAVPPRKLLAHLLADRTPKNDPVFLTPGMHSDSEFTPNVVDAWGAPLVIEFSDRQVTVSSKHTAYAATEPLRSDRETARFNDHPN